MDWDWFYIGKTTRKLIQPNSPQTPYYLQVENIAIIPSLQNAIHVYITPGTWYDFIETSTVNKSLKRLFVSTPCTLLTWPDRNAYSLPTSQQMLVIVVEWQWDTWSKSPLERVSVTGRIPVSDMLFRDKSEPYSQIGRDTFLLEDRTTRQAGNVGRTWIFH